MLVCRSWDGLTLYAASSDGTLGVFNFQPEELEGIAPHSAQEQYLQKFGFVPPPLPEGFAHQPSAPAAAPAQEVVAPQPEAKPTPLARQDRAQSSPTGFDQPPATVNGFGEHVHKLVAKRSKKKETRPTTTNVSSTNDDLDYPLEMDVHIDSLNTSERTSKRKASVAELADDPRPSKPRTLGGDRTREAAVVKLIGSTVASSIPTPMLVTFLNTNVEGSADDSFEARNSETLGTCGQLS
jgi:protein HIRA/HIR1